MQKGPKFDMLLEILWFWSGIQNFFDPVSGMEKFGSGTLQQVQTNDGG